VTSREHLRAALKEAFGRGEPAVVEVRVDAAHARARHAAVRRAVSAALREAAA
jgi:thiamine pyrophosphate-dependent acetolactate synthase large subunit-like protein